MWEKILLHNYLAATDQFQTFLGEEMCNSFYCDNISENEVLRGNPEK